MSALGLQKLGAPVSHAAANPALATATVSFCKCRALTTTCSHHMVGFIPMHRTMLAGEKLMPKCSTGCTQPVAETQHRALTGVCAMHDILFILFSCIGPAIAAKACQQISLDLCLLFSMGFCLVLYSCIYTYIYIYWYIVIVFLLLSKLNAYSSASLHPLDNYNYYTPL